MLWNVDRTLIEIGPIAVSWYGLLFAGGFLLGLTLLQWVYRREGRDPRELDVLLWYVLAGVVLGMRLVHCLVYEPEYYLSQPWEILKIWRGGYASHGGALGLIVAVWWYCRRPGRPPFLWLLDRLAIVGPLGGACIRIGNFFNSEIVGKPTDAPIGIVFVQVDELARHPVQLYEAVAYLATFALLLTLYRRSSAARTGLLSGIFLVCLFGARFLLEYFKAPQSALEVDAALTFGQLLSLPFVAVGVVLLARARSPRVSAPI